MFITWAMMRSEVWGALPIGAHQIYLRPSSARSRLSAAFCIARIIACFGRRRAGVTDIRTCAGGRDRPASNLGDRLGKLVQPVARTIAGDEVVVAQPVDIALVHVGRVHDDVHVRSE